jgi:hypothetical protein
MWRKHTIKSTEYQEEIYYYTEDIDLSEAGEYACNGVSSSGKEYAITFKRNGTTFRPIELYPLD